MEDNTILSEALFQRVEEYMNTSIELLKYKAVYKTSEVVASLASRLLIITAIIVFMLMLGAGVAFWLGDILGKVYYGFFIVAGVYGMVGGLLYGMRSKVKQNVSDLFISEALN